MNGRRLQWGYMDNQVPPILVGMLLILPVVNYVATAEVVAGWSAVAVYFVILLAFACFCWGVYLNLDSLKYPESSFNKHTSPVFIAVLIAGCLGYGAWTVRGGPLPGLVYIFGAGIVAVVAAMLYSSTRKNKNDSRSGLP